MWHFINPGVSVFQIVIYKRDHFFDSWFEGTSA